MVTYDVSCIGCKRPVEHCAGLDVRPASRAENACTVVDEGGTSTTSTTQVQVVEPPTQDQRRWDGRDAQSHALIALSVKRSIIPHIRYCKTAKEAWDFLANLYQARNEARVAYLRKQLEAEHGCVPYKD